jgi:NADPH-dependent 7-cyano-7-deazaguanine reductase QueF
MSEIATMAGAEGVRAELVLGCAHRCPGVAGRMDWDEVHVHYDATVAVIDTDSLGKFLSQFEDIEITAEALAGEIHRAVRRAVTARLPASEEERGEVRVVVQGMHGPAQVYATAESGQE